MSPSISSSTVYRSRSDSALSFRSRLSPRKRSSSPMKRISTECKSPVDKPGIYASNDATSNTFTLTRNPLVVTGSSTKDLHSHSRTHSASSSHKCSILSPVESRSPSRHYSRSPRPVPMSSPSRHSPQAPVQRSQSLPREEEITVRYAMLNGFFEAALEELIREEKDAAVKAEARKIKTMRKGWYYAN